MHNRPSSFETSLENGSETSVERAWGIGERRFSRIDEGCVSGIVCIYTFLTESVKHSSTQRLPISMWVSMKKGALCEARRESRRQAFVGEDVPIADEDLGTIDYDDDFETSSNERVSERPGGGPYQGLRYPDAADKNSISQTTTVA